MDLREALRLFARFMHSWFVTVVFAVLFIATLVGWVFVGVRFGYDKIVRDGFPMPPPTEVVPVPETWKVLSDDACSGNHCSTRVVMLTTSDAKLPTQVTLAYTKAFEQAGYRTRLVGEKVVGSKDGVTIDASWVPGTETVQDVKVNVGFENRAAGIDFWQDAIVYKHIEGFYRNLVRLTIVTIALIATLWLTESLAQEPRMPQSKRSKRPRGPTPPPPPAPAREKAAAG